MLTKIALAALPFVFAHPTPTDPAPPTPGITDIDILNYALTLEHLENAFYKQGLQNYSLDAFKAAGYDETFYTNLKEISFDESTHVSFLTTAIESLGATAVPESTYAFPSTDVISFLTVASILEGVGVSAYLGAAASIVDKTYLTAAGSILTVESRHSAYLRDGLKQSPFPQPFDAPLDFNQVFTLAAPFIVATPEGAPTLPVKAFPALAVDPSSKPATNATITLTTAEPIHSHDLYAAWIAVTGPTLVPVEATFDKTFTVTVPPGFHGQSYVVLIKGCGEVTDDTTVAGPAIVEVAGSSGTEGA